MQNWWQIQHEIHLFLDFYVWENDVKVFQRDIFLR